MALVVALGGLPGVAQATGLWPDLSQPAPRRGGGEGDVAVIVGIEDYVDLPAVPGADDNARDWYLWFTETRKTPVEQVHLLRDRQATREGILDELDRAAAQADPHGTIWFVFIGHGAPSSDGKDGILLGWDTQQTARSVFARGLTQSEVLDVLEQHPNAVAILDACFSGRASGGETLVEGLQPVVPEYAVDPESTTVLTAAETAQFAGPLPGAARPAFSYLVLGALRGWGDTDGNGRITGGEVVAYTSKAMVTVVQDRDQSPVGFGPGRDRTLARGNERAPDLARIVLEAEALDAVVVEDERHGTAEPWGSPSATSGPTTPARVKVTGPRSPSLEGPAFGLTAQSNTGMLESDNPTALDYAYWFSGDMLFTLAIPFSNPGGPMRHSAFTVNWGVGGGWKDMRFPDQNGSTSFVHIPVGVGQYLAGIDPRGNRMGIYLGQGLIFNVGAEDDYKSVQGDLYVMWALHDPNGFFLGIGGRLGLYASGGKAAAVPALTVRWGGLDFWR